MRKEALGPEVFSSPDNEMVSKVKYDNLEKEYKKKLGKANEEKDHFKKDNQTLREDKGRLENKLKETGEMLQNSEAEVKSLKDQLRSEQQNSKDLAQQLKERPVETIIQKDDSEIESLKKKKKAVEDELDHEKEQVSKLEKEIDCLQAEKESLEKRVKELESEIENKPDSLDSIGTVQWLTETEFFSDLFTEKKYSVRLARSGEYMTFLPDVEGKCRCEGGKIVIPDMGRYLDFKKTDFQAYADGKMIRIVL